MAASPRPAAHIDTTQELRLVQSPVKPALIVFTALVLTAICVGMAVPLFPNAPSGDRRQLYWWFGALFFLVGAIAVLKQSFGDNRPVLTLTPRGFRFNTVSAREIPWTAVQGIHNWRQRRNHIIIVKVTDDTWQSAGMTPEALGARAANKLQGIDGIAISPAGLPMHYQQLIRTFQSYAQAHGGRI